MKLFILILLLLSATGAFAQDQHAWELVRNLSQNLNGWNFSVTENVARHGFGGMLEVRGHYKSPSLLGVATRERMHSILYGPTFSIRKIKGLKPFAHVLIGLAHADARVTPTGPHLSQFAVAGEAGGGIDIVLGRKAAIRALQPDYFRTNVLGTRPNSYRASAGIVYYPGK